MRKAAGIMLIILGVVLPFGTAGQTLPPSADTWLWLTPVGLLLMGLIIGSGIYGVGCQ